MSCKNSSLKYEGKENLQFKEDHTMSRKSKFVGLSPWKAGVKREDNCIAIQVQSTKLYLENHSHRVHE